MKKLLVMAASLALIITLSVTGTIAFKSVGGGDGKKRARQVNSQLNTLAETQGAVNTQPERKDGMIKQTISYRNKSDNTKMIEITPKENDPSQLLPSPNSEGLTAASGNTFWNVGGLDRIVTVTNKSNTLTAEDGTTSPGVSLYVRTVFAFENPNKIVDNLILLNYNADTTVGTWEEIEDNATIDNKPYKLFVYTYKNALAPGATTPPSLKQVVLRAAATNEDVAVLNGGFEMRVVSEAVESTVANTAEAAFKATFEEITISNNPWASGYGAKSLNGASTASVSN